MDPQWLHGTDLDPRDIDTNQTHLHYAASIGNLEAVQYLLAAGAPINALDDDQWTPLRLAVDQGHLQVVRCLLAAGANPNIESYMGFSCLGAATIRRNPEVVRALLDAGAAVNYRTRYAGRTALLDLIEWMT